MVTEKSSSASQGVDLLKHPILPIARIVQFLYLALPSTSVDSVLDELTEPVETVSAVYPAPGEILRPYLPILKNFEMLKKAEKVPWIILNEQYEQEDVFEAISLMVGQQIITRELETINSQLCGPCRCDLCCVGPSNEMQQDFFEIPLAADEINLFDLPCIDTAESRNLSALTEPPFSPDNIPFYKNPQALYHWKTGWSIILPKETACPHLDRTSGGCVIYDQRPVTCRRPQIFPYLLEPLPDRNRDENGTVVPAYVARKKILAIWDCPHVQEFKQEIAEYAEMCELEPVFKKNKG
ncbi:MAG: YkgJ family cysteine cluster protein [Proteobacteria bacterium]|nr:YkgJ family cysteine cluster protein [Pseudomonadota bacterium]MBU1710267.1 YkgJ family cysteine cluster protein [Pseudomonadota bacterium]